MISRLIQEVHAALGQLAVNASGPAWWRKQHLRRSERSITPDYLVSFEDREALQRLCGGI